MGRKSVIDRLPKQVRTKIIGLMDGGKTLDEIMDALDLTERGVSRSSLGRYKVSADRIMSKMREQRAMAEAIVSANRTDLDSKTARLNVQLLHSIITDVVTAAQDGGSLEPKEAESLAKALDALARVEKQDADLVARLRTEAKAEAEAKMRAKLEAMLPEQDLSELSDDELEQEIVRAIQQTRH